MRVKSLKINALLNGIKQVMSIAYPLITFPYIARTLGNESFGSYSFSLSIATYFLLIAALGIKNYAIREGAKLRDDKNKINIFCSQLYSLGIISSLLSFGALLLFLHFFDNKMHEYSVAIIILGLAMFIDAFGADWVNSIFEDYLYITIRSIVFQLISIFLMFFLVKTPEDIIPYCIISLVASHGGNLVNIFYLKKYVKIRLTLKLDLKKHLKPIIVFFTSVLTITVYVSADITMLGFIYDDTIVGIYGFVTRIYTLIKNIVYAIVIVSVPRLSYTLINNKERLQNLYQEVFDLISLFVLPVVIGLFCLSENIIVIAGGNQYIQGTTSLMILSVAIAFGIYSTFYSDCVLVVNGQEKKCLIATSITALLNIILNVFMLPKWGIDGAAISTLLAEMVNYIVQRWFGKKTVNLNLNKKNLISCVLGSIFVFIFSYFVIKPANGILSFLTRVCICIIGYFLICFFAKNTVLTNVISSLTKKR